MNENITYCCIEYYYTTISRTILSCSLISLSDVVFNVVGFFLFVNIKNIIYLSTD